MTPRRVLVVDDEVRLTRSLVRLLGSFGFECAGAENGSVALALLEARPVDVIVCDVRMPELDGPGLLAELRRRGDTTPFIFLTGYADLADEGLRALGAAEVLVKPVGIDTLVECLERALG